MVKNKEEQGAIVIPELEMRTVRIGLLGLTPYICNRMAKKAKEELLNPSKRALTSADRAVRPQKHNPLEEYRDSPERLVDGPTLLGVKAAAIKKAMATAALDMPGAKKAQIARLVWVPADRSGLLPLYGVPELWMAVVRQAGMNRTPDIRTRAAIPRWGCVVDIQYVHPLLTQVALTRLASAAGRMVGIGDGRQEKGALDFGQFTIVAPDDSDLLRVIEEGGRAAQQAAMAEPVFYDADTAELYATWAPRQEDKGRLVTAGRNGGSK
jgi:hypothetical protein